MKTKLLALLPAFLLAVLAIAGVAGAAGGFRTAYQPPGTGIIHIDGGVEVGTAGLVVAADVDPDSGIVVATGPRTAGYAPVALADGGVAWAQVAAADGGSSGNATQLQGKAVSATAPTDAQLWMYESGSSTWTPVTISGGDLITSTTPYGQITVANAGGTGNINFGTGAITFNGSLGGGTVAPVISQGPLTTASGTGKALTVQAQSETGTGATIGGALNLSSGNGSTLGNINFQSGAGAYTLTSMNGNTGAWTWGQTAAMSLGQTATTGTAANATIAAQSSTGASTTGGELDLNPGTGTTKSGNVVMTLQTSANGSEPYFKINRNLAGTTSPIFLMGHWPAGLANGNGIWLGAAASAPSTSNFNILEYSGALQFNAQTGNSLQFQIGNVSAFEVPSATVFQVDAPTMQSPPNAAASTAGQSLSIVGANNTGTGTASTGGALNVTGGSSANGAGGAINIIGGAGDTTGGTLGNGGNVLVSGGGSTAGGGVGGNVTIQAGGDPGGNGPGSIVLGGAASTTALISVSAPMYGTAGAYYGMVNGYSTVPVGGSVNVLVPTTLAVSHYLDLTGAITANINVVLPISAGTEWCVGNLTTGAFTIKLYNGTTSGSAPGTAVTLSTPGSTAALGAKCTRVWSDGTYLRLAE